MNTFALISTLLGGIGLFMLGMWLLTDGLKLAAGDALQRVLARWTRTDLRALLSGYGLTAAVQSSAAVTVTTLGFVNAGVLTLRSAIWIVFGANIGTTMTGWIVALTGLQVKLDVYALPAIGVGMLLRISGPGSRRAAWGSVLVGFAAFLLGVQTLRGGFSDLTTLIDFSALPQSGPSAWGLYFIIGLLLTVLIQSSSATTAITLSAVAAGLVPVHLAAITIIAADLGTTITAIVAALGATANVRRVAAAQVSFNLTTAVLSLSLLMPLLAIAGFVQSLLPLPQVPEMRLAIFSTTFNVLGIVLVAPLVPRLVAILSRRFVTQEEDLARLRYLDAAATAIPALAIPAVVRELQRLGALALELARDGVTATLSAAEVARRVLALGRLAELLRQEVSRLTTSPLTREAAQSLAPLLRALQHYEDMVELAPEAMALRSPPDGELAGAARRFSGCALEALQAADTATAGFSMAALTEVEQGVEEAYEAFKTALLDAGACGVLQVELMDRQLRVIAALRRVVDRSVHAAARLQPFLERRAESLAKT